MKSKLLALTKVRYVVENICDILWQLSQRESQLEIKLIALFESETVHIKMKSPVGPLDENE